MSIILDYAAYRLEHSEIWYYRAFEFPYYNYDNCIIWFPSLRSFNTSKEVRCQVHRFFIP